MRQLEGRVSRAQHAKMGTWTHPHIATANSYDTDNFSRNVTAAENYSVKRGPSESPK